MHRKISTAAGAFRADALSRACWTSCPQDEEIVASSQMHTCTRGQDFSDRRSSWGSLAVKQHREVATAFLLAHPPLPAHYAYARPHGPTLTRACLAPFPRYTVPLHLIYVKGHGGVLLQVVIQLLLYCQCLPSPWQITATPHPRPRGSLRRDTPTNQTRQTPQ